MALSFPLALDVFADVLPISRPGVPKLFRNEEISGLGSGQILTAELAPPLWHNTIELAPLSYDLNSRIASLIEALAGSKNNFYIYGFGRHYPLNDPDGSILGSNVVTISALSSGDLITLAGLPSGYVLSVGDWLSFDFASGTKRAFHRIVYGATASGGGTAQIQVIPHYNYSVVTGLTVTLKKPSYKAFVVPNGYDPGYYGGKLVTGVKLEFMQRL